MHNHYYFSKAKKIAIYSLDKLLDYGGCLHVEDMSTGQFSIKLGLKLYIAKKFRHFCPCRHFPQHHHQTLITNTHHAELIILIKKIEPTTYL